jgi:hypothetical protein
MTVMLGVERPTSADLFTAAGENYRMPVSATVAGQQAVAATCPLSSVGTTPLTTVTATIHCSSIVLPQNLPVRNIVSLVTVAGTVTGFWVALLDAGLIVRAVSANTTTPSTGFFSQSVLPPSTVPFVTAYSGLFYAAIGTVSTVAPQIGTQAALPTVAAASGPPVYCGTSATAATVTPPAVGAQLGALTGVASNAWFALLT